MPIAAKAIVVLAAIYFLILGALALVRPAVARGFLLGLADGAAKHYAELLARVLVGVSLVLIAGESAYATLISAFGWLLIVTTAVMALVPWRVHRRFAAAVVPKTLRFLPMIGIASLAIGALLLWVVAAGIAA